MEGKCRHGQITKEAEKETINTNETWKWLNQANLKIEKELLITACQEHAITTNYMKTRIMNNNADLKCRLYRAQPETIM